MRDNESAISPILSNTSLSSIQFSILKVLWSLTLEDKKKYNNTEIDYEAAFLQLLHQHLTPDVVIIIMIIINYLLCIDTVISCLMVLQGHGIRSRSLHQVNIIEFWLQNDYLSLPFQCLCLQFKTIYNNLFSLESE